MDALKLNLPLAKNILRLAFYWFQVVLYLSAHMLTCGALMKLWKHRAELSILSKCINYFTSLTCK